jgi:transposase InsO family protein
MDDNRHKNVADTAAILGISERAVRKKIKSGELRAEKHPINKAPGWEWQIDSASFSTEAKAKHALTQKSENTPLPFENDSDIDSFEDQPLYKKQEAEWWLSVIREFGGYSKKQGRRKRMQALKSFIIRYRVEHPDERQFSWQTLMRKIRQFHEHGLPGLVNGYGVAQRFAPFSDEAWAWVKEKFLNINQPTADWCYSELMLESKGKNWEIPSKGTVLRSLRQLPYEDKVFFREGEKKWREKCLPSILRDYESMTPGEVFVADHAQINVAVKHPSGRTIFPWFTGWVDMRTRKILGWKLADTPSSDTINISLKHTIEKYGVPEHAIIDNGRDFSSLHFTGGQKNRFRFKVNEGEVRGIYHLLNIEAHFCIPANARAKNIERWFWTQEMQFQTAFPTYRGNNVVNRPQDVDKRIKNGKDVLDWAEFEECISNYIERYNQDHVHRGHGMEGRSPNLVWNEYFEKHSLRRVSPASLRLLMMKASKPVKVGRFGITAFGAYYRSDALMDHIGEHVVYRHDPKNLAEIHIYTKDWAYLCQAEQVNRTAWDDEEAYLEMRLLEKKRKRALKAEREASEGLATVEFGYQMREPSGDNPDKPADLIRLLKTPLDGVQKQIDAEEKVAAQGGSRDIIEAFKAKISRDLEERNKKTNERHPFFDRYSLEANRKEQ